MNQIAIVLTLAEVVAIILAILALALTTLYLFHLLR